MKRDNLENYSSISTLCSFCPKMGRLRCSVCKSWYCTQFCQINHWPTHKRECVPVPHLEWPDGSKYNGTLEGGDTDKIDILANTNRAVLKNGVLLEPVAMAISIESGDASVGSESKDAYASAEGDNKFKLKKTKAETSISNSGNEILKPTVLAVQGPVVTTTSSLSTVDVASQDASTSKVKTSQNYSKISSSMTSIAIDPPCSSMNLKSASSVACNMPTIPKAEEVCMSMKAPSSDDMSRSLKVSSSVAEQSSDKITPKVPTSCGKDSVQQIEKSGADNSIEKDTSRLQPKDTVNNSKVNRHPGIANDSLKEPASCKPQVPIKPQKSEETKSGVSNPQTSYPSSFESSSLPSQAPPLGKLLQIVLPVDYVSSPGDFVVRLIIDDGVFVNLLTGMNETPPPVVKGWKVGKRETVAVCYEDVWYRGLAVKKVETKFYIYLLDIGGKPIEVTADKIRPLPRNFMTSPAIAYQVSLAGVGPMVGNEWPENVGQNLMEVFNSDENYKLGVEFSGERNDDRWVVKMKGIEDDEDIANLLIQAELAKVKEISLNKSSTTESSLPTLDITGNLSVINSVKIDEQPLTDSKTHANLEKIQLDDGVAGEKIARGSLSKDTQNLIITVCSFESPNKFFVCPNTSSDSFLSILEVSQSAPRGKVLPTVASSCLACDEECWYRAEILCYDEKSRSVSLFLIDDGRTLSKPVESLKPMPKDLATTAGLVCEVSLKGVKAEGNVWTKSSIDGASLVLDVGGETQFKVTKIELDSSGIQLVDLVDNEGNDVSKLMIEMGLVVSDKLSFIYDSLPAGKQKLLILSAISPMELVLCPEDKFIKFSDEFVASIAKSVDGAPAITSPNVGDIVLACEDEIWYRAIVTKVTDAASVIVCLVDVAISTSKKLDQIRQCNSDILKERVLGVTCCLESWKDEDAETVKVKWGPEELAKIVEPYSVLDVDVVKEHEGKWLVKIPLIDDKLGKKSLTPKELLMNKLKVKR